MAAAHHAVAEAAHDEARERAQDDRRKTGCDQPPPAAEVKAETNGHNRQGDEGPAISQIVTSRVKRIARE